MKTLVTGRRRAIPPKKVVVDVEHQPRDQWDKGLDWLGDALISSWLHGLEGEPIADVATSSDSGPQKRIRRAGLRVM